MSDVFKYFVGQYALDRTISMRLKPKTREDQDEEMFWSEFLEDKDDDTPAVLKNDKLRAIAYPVVKRCLDQMHKMFIEQALFYADIDWQPLLMSYAKCNSKLENILKCNFEDAIESAEPIVDAQGIYRGKIIDILTKHPWWSSIEKGNQKIFQDVLPQLISNEGFINEVKIGLKDEELPNYTKPRLEEQIGLFSKGFTMYFNKYKKNRDNMYSEKDQDTAIANRLVNENFSKYADNFIVYHRLKDLCQEELSLVEAEILPLLSELGLSCIADLFKANSYNLLLIQKRIDIYNQIIGRLNSLGNESWSQKKPKNLKRKDFLMSTLFKQILSDRVRPSYLPEQFAEGEKGFEELLTSIAKFYDSLMSGYLDELERVLSTIKETDADLSHIYISGKNISTLSNKLYGDWNVLAETIRDNKIGQKTKKNKKDKEDLTKPIEKWSEDQIISIQDIKDVECQIQKATTQDAISFLSSFKIIKKKDEKTECIDILQRVCSNYVNKWNVLLEQYNAGQLNKDNAKNVIKEILDDLQTVNRYCKLFNLGKHEGKYEKATFYTELESLQASSVQYPVVISEIEPLYNKVRAYMTRKDYIKGKMLVKFDCSTLAKGWNSSAFIVIKDNKFYVVIDNGIDEEDWLQVKKDTDASRVVYSQQKMDFKNFPRLFLFSKGDNEAPAVQQYGLPINNVKTEYLYYRSLSQSRKKAYLEVHKDFQTRLIKYYMTCITRHESTKPYSATLKKAWKNPEEYQNLQEFYDDCDCCYSLSFESINLSELINLSRERKAFVFQLYNKDFAEKAHGKENLHTMYWRELFSPENLKDVVFKLSSEGTELFYRAKHEGRQTVHKKGEFVVNKVLKNGNPIPNDVFLLYKQNLRNGVIDLNNVHVDENDEKAKKTLTDAKKLLAEDLVKEPHQLNVDIQKNARFYRHEMQIHIPIRINFGCKGAYLSKFNEYTLQQLRKHKDELNIIGIDRGERNLIYVSVLDQKGNMLEPPHSFNIIESENYDNFVRRYDYLSKLKEVEINRDKQRKSWDAIENIKQLKSGYLSMVVHEISKMMVKHHAIIIMENLNWGFKKGRFSVERQVYQKFEEALINKLSYLAFKSGSPSPEYGNIRNGLQLAVPVKSLKDVRTQCGWLFYVPAGYTSKIDPATGFANLFSMTNAKANPRQFFENFEKIEYRNGAYHFTFDYSKTDSDGRKVFPVTQTDYINQWTVSSYGERIQIQRNKDNGFYTPVHINLTDELDKLLADKKIERNGLSLEKIKSCEDDDFFSKLFYYFSLILQMRNSEPGKEDKEDVDYLISPVVRDGRQFTSYDAANNNGIADADANGAYHIALKGLYLLRNDFPADGISNEKWFEFAQTKPYLIK